MMRSAIDAANRIQAQAAAPDRSVILRAAAGSGKTRVLVDRFVRLCLTGVPARSILAVTFTPTPARDITPRLSARAPRPPRATPDELQARLTQLLGVHPTAAQVERAAWLYEQLLDDPGGLHVGTIHSFCQSVLERFAAQAGVDPRFAVLEDEQELWDEANERLAAEIADDPSLRADAAQLGLRPEGLADELRRLRDDRVHLQRWLGRIRDADPTLAERPVGGRGGDLALLPRLLADLRSVLFDGTALAGSEQPSPLDLVPAAAAALRHFAGAGLDGVAAAETEGLTAQFPATMDRYRTRATALAAALQNLTEGEETEARRLVGEGADLLLTKDRTKLRSFTGKQATKEARQAAFAAAAAPFLHLWSLVDLIDLYRWNRALLRLGLRALDIYAALKRRDRLVDFHDLEHLTWAVMRDPQLGPWIQYRLDASLDHLLVDEFQDTNRNQWEILQPLVEEILAGESDRPRSVFLVGDVKQSIYGFRGAAPEVFREVQRWLEPHPAVDQLTLPTNFRSRPDLVATLGRLFNAHPLAAIIGPEEAADAKQRAARSSGTSGTSGTSGKSGTSGASDVAGAPEVLFVAPLTPSDEGPTADERAASATAALVCDLVATGTVDTAAPEEPERLRPLTYGDILVLCRNRTQITLYEQALRRAQVPIVPAGRGLLARSREVQDMLALLRWLAYPADDIALAAVLRSPLVRASEETVQRALGARRSGAANERSTLWDLLRRRGEEFGLGAAARLLQGWLRGVGRQDVHALVRRIYRESHALDRFAAALGEQARYNLIRLLDLTLSADLGPAPTLRRLAAVIERAERAGSEQEGAAPPTAGRGRVRLMTVHAAKGLEAPVVILVDAAAFPRDGFASQELPGGHRPLVYGLRRHHRAGPELAGVPLDVPLAGPAAARAAADLAEEAHILYVALSRARDRLYVLGGQPHRRSQIPSFLGWLTAAAEADGPVRPYGVVSAAWVDRLLAESAAPTGSGTGGDDATAPAVVGPPVQAWQPPPLGKRIDLDRPSAVGGAGDPPPVYTVASDPGLAEASDDGAYRAAAVSRGERIHLLLQLAAERGSMPPPTAADTAAREAWEEAAAVYANPEFDRFFRAGDDARGLCELPVIARRPGDTTERRLVGVIDRLVVRPDRVDIVDYKSNRIADDASRLDALAQHYRDQLAAYRDVVRTLYPDREVRSFLLFTHPTTAQGCGVLREVT